MKKLTKTIVSLLLLTFAVTLAACGKDDSKQTQEDSSEENTSLITVGYAQCGSESAWRIANTESIQQYCSEENGIKLIFENAEGDIDKQIASVRSFIEQKVDIIGLAPVVADGWDDVLKEAKAAGIPVILVDRTVNTEDDSLYTCWIGSDFLLEGYKAADWIIEYMNSLGRGTDKLNVALLQGTLGAGAELGRTQGVEEMLNAKNNYQFVYKDTGDFTTDGGIDNMQKILDKKLKVDILISENDDMTMGAIQVMEENGLKPGKDITILTFDGVKAAFEAMVDGKINCTVECNPLSGKSFVETVQKVMNGDSVEKKVYVQEDIFPSDTAADYIDHRKY